MLTFIADAPTALDQGATTSRVQIAKTGKFKDPRYGEFSITLADFAKWTANFEKHARAGDRAGLPVDIDHGPERRGDTTAAGWITELSVEGNELWATVEWNSLGRELVSDRRYLYLSPTYHHDFKDEQGRSHGTALVGVALTNRPFLSMATVSLSKDEALGEVVGTTTSDSRPAMKTLLSKLGLPEDATEEQAVTALDAKLAESATAAAPEKTLDQLAGEAGKIVLSADEFTQMKTDATAGAAAAKELHQTKFDTAWATALSKATVTPAEEEGQRRLYDLAPEATLDAIAARHPVANTERRSATGAPVPASSTSAHTTELDREPVDAGRAALHDRAVVLAAEKGIDYVDAVILAEQEGVA